MRRLHCSFLLNRSLAACAAFLALALAANGASQDVQESRTYQLTNSRLIVLEGAQEEFRISVGPNVALLSFDLAHDFAGKVHGFMWVEMQHLSVVTNLLATNQVVSVITNTTARLFGPITGLVSGNAGQQKVTLSAKVTSGSDAAVPKRLHGRFFLTGGLEGDVVTLGGKGSWQEQNSSASLTFVNRALKTAAVGNPVITASLFPLRMSGDENKGAATFSSEAQINLSNAVSCAVAGKLSRKWDVARGRFEEKGSLKGSHVAAAARVSWRARSPSPASATAALAGRVYGQHFSETVPLAGN